MGVSHLLDTHVIVWIVAGQRSSVRRSVLRAIESESSTTVVSAVSAFEIATKVRLGKLDAARPVIDRWDDVLDGLGARELAVDHRAARRAGELAWENRDPFDRLLAAQAITAGMTLVTADPAFDDVPGLSLLRW